MKNYSNTLFVPALLTAALLPHLANAHGWVEFPQARQSICYQDGGFWSSNGQDIPNAACKAAFDQSGAYPFVQRNEVAMLVRDFRNMAAVKAQITDGTLCSAGTQAKAGLNIPSPHWQKTNIKADANGQIELVFHATAPHNPSYWEFYLTRADYDHSASISWDDLELIDTAGNVSVDADKRYRIKVTLPQGRSGDAVLFTRWQRDDAAGEGFYNCSDIRFSDDGDSGGGETPDPDQPQLTVLGYFLPQGFPVPEPGQSVAFRAFDASGNELLEERLLISHSNQDDWAELLALQVGDKHDEFTIGIWHQAMNHYMFDRDNLYANQVWSSVTDASYVLSLIETDTTPPPVEAGHWDINATYVSGDIVKHRQQSWKAHWWTKGEEPGATGEWGVWRLTQETGSPQPEPEPTPNPELPCSSWSSTAIYTEGDTVQHAGKQWRAHWWTQGEEPGTTGQWGVWRVQN